MNRSITARWGLVALLATSPALADQADPCTDPKTVAINSWLLEVNDADQSSRENLIASMKLLSTGGVSVNAVFAYDDYPGITYAVSFDPSYWADKEAGEKAKNDMLRAWAKLPGNLIRCNGLVFPTPGIGVSN